MNIFGWRKNLSISEQNPTFKVRYLGNVQTSVMKGDGCVDRATNIIWSNHLRNEHPGIEMKVELTGSGMKAFTKDQGLTEYLAPRISYCIAHKDFPRLFVWVYRHEGRKAKMELRCHAVLCKNEAKAKAIALQLCEKLKGALQDFKREKIHLQNSRLVLQKTNSVPITGSLLPLRTQLLSTAKNFKPPPSSRTNSAAKLGAIFEDREEPLLDECLEEEEEEEEEEGEEAGGLAAITNIATSTRTRIPNNSSSSTSTRMHVSVTSSSGRGAPSSPSLQPPSPSASAGPTASGLLHKGKEHHDILEALDLDATGSNEAQAEAEAALFAGDDVIDLEFGNDLGELERDGGVQYCLNENVDSDEESAESGFHDQEASFPESEQTEGGGEEEKRKTTTTRLRKGVGEGVEEINGDNEAESGENEVCVYPSPDCDLLAASSSPSSSNGPIENTAL